MLIAAGGPLEIKNADGKTPLYLLREFDREDWLLPD
jgi:hypothetical protein